MPQWFGIRAIRQVVRGQQGADGFLQPRDMLGQVDQRHGEVTRAVQDADGQRGDQHQIADRRLAAAPEQNAPSGHAGDQHRRDDGMDQAQPLQIDQAAAARVHLDADGGGDAPLLPERGAERAHHRHVADHVHQLAIDRGGLGREAAMQRRAASREIEHQHTQAGRCHDQRGRHHQVHHADEDDRANHRDAGRQHVPRAGVLRGECGIGGGGDAAGECARQAFGEVARRVAGQMTEQVAPDVAGHRHERIGSRPAGATPQQIVGGDQPAEDGECLPETDRFLRSGRNNIHQVLDPVLDRHGTGHCHQHGKEDSEVSPRSASHIAPQEPDRVSLQARQIRRAVVPHFSRNRCHFHSTSGSISTRNPPIFRHIPLPITRT